MFRVPGEEDGETIANHAKTLEVVRTPWEETAVNRRK